MESKDTDSDKDYSFVNNDGDDDNDAFVDFGDSDLTGLAAFLDGMGDGDVVLPLMDESLAEDSTENLESGVQTGRKRKNISAEALERRRLRNKATAAKSRDEAKKRFTDLSTSIEQAKESMRRVDNRTFQSLLRLYQHMKRDGSLPNGQPIISIFPESIRAQIVGLMSRPEFAKQLALLETFSSTTDPLEDTPTAVDVSNSLAESSRNQQDTGASGIAAPSIADMKEPQPVGLIRRDRGVDSKTDDEMII